ncbi:uncharacterized protein METZ01_LOCUS158381 [marine metagenome]|uniref:AMP-dependent synthetase/ligase domain-containing protein n=1 Tax=marine metagenome TaxID=408172 RepID=A0A382AX53_9ZZZZ
MIRNPIVKNATTNSDKNAILEHGKSTTYSELAENCSRVAGTLIDLGIRPGDRIALLAMPTTQYLETFSAITGLGCAFIPLNTRLTIPELAEIFRDCAPKILICDQEHKNMGEQLIELTRLSKLFLLNNLFNSSSSSLLTEHRPDTIHSIIYTSGTTGTPKGVILTWENLYESAEGSLANLRSKPDDLWLCCLPLNHIGGLSIPIRTAFSGTCTLLHDGFDPVLVSTVLREQSVSLVSLVPTMLRRLLEVDKKNYPPTLRSIIVGGGPVEKDLLKQALQRGLPVIQTYGMTETSSQITTLAPTEAQTHLGSAGRPLGKTKVQIYPDKEQLGEILVQGPVVTSGYLNNPKKTAEAIKDGWFYTGDVGTIDKQGFLYVHARKDDLIITGGENVNPSEIEESLLEWPGITAAAAIGITDTEWGQRIVVAFTSDNEIAINDLDNWLKERLANFKIPKQYLRVKTLPTTANGKIKRSVLKKLFES